MSEAARHMSKPLPELLALYADMAGQAAMMKLAKDYGGVCVYLPKPENLNDGHHLVRSLGRKPAATLCKEFGPGEIEIPLGPWPRRTTLVEEIRMLGENPALTNRDIARRLGTTERWVREVLNRPARTSDSLSLF